MKANYAVNDIYASEILNIKDIHSKSYLMSFLQRPLAKKLAS